MFRHWTIFLPVVRLSIAICDIIAYKHLMVHAPPHRPPHNSNAFNRTSFCIIDRDLQTCDLQAYIDTDLQTCDLQACIDTDLQTCDYTDHIL